MEYTVISGTNRKGSNTRKVAEQMLAMLSEKGVEAGFLSLEGLDLNAGNAELSRIEAGLLFPARKFVIVSPEYNGSYPGVLKSLIDHSDIRRSWWGKKAMLTGVSTGRAGNLRGMEHLTGTLNYVKVTVLPNKLPISMVDKLMDGEGRIMDAPTLAAIDAQLSEFIDF